MENNVSKELVLVAEIKQPVIMEWNKEDILFFMEEVKNTVNNLEFSEDNLSNVTDTRKKLSNLRKAMKEKIKSIKQNAEQPIKDFIDVTTECLDEINNLYRKTKEFEDEFTVRYQQEKMKKIWVVIDELLKETTLREEYTNKINIKSEYLNKTTTFKFIKSDVEKLIYELKTEQDKEDEKNDSCKKLCEQNNVDYEDVKYFTRDNTLVDSIQYINKFIEKRKKQEEERLKKEEARIELEKKRAQEEADRKIKEAELKAEREKNAEIDKLKKEAEVEEKRIKKENEEKIRLEKQKAVEEERARVEKEKKLQEDKEKEEKVEVKQDVEENKKVVNKNTKQFVFKFDITMMQMLKMTKYFKENNISFEKTEEISDEDFERVRFSHALESAGVDNWEGYDRAKEIIEEWDQEDAE